MIEGILRNLFQITFSASLLIVLLLILRKVFTGRVRPTWQYAAWILVLIRLLIPVNISSPTSVMNIFEHHSIAALETHPTEYQAFPYLASKPQSYSEYPNNLAVYEDEQDITFPLEKSNVFQPLFSLWLVGVCTVFGYMVVLNMVFASRLWRKTSIKVVHSQIPFYRDLCQQVGVKGILPVVMSYQIPSPCLVGLFRPYIALTPESVRDTTMLKHVLLHELNHFKQKDNLFSLLRIICCAIYWFNPLVWVAASVSREDSELSCDDRVLYYLDDDEGIEYGYTLLSLFSTCNRKAIYFDTTAIVLGESSLKRRIRIIINRPKKLKIVSGLALISMILLGLITLTGAKNEPAYGKLNLETKAPVMDIGTSDLFDKGTTSLHLNEDGTKRLLDMESLRKLAEKKLTFNDIINGYTADKVIENETDGYTAWQYTLDNDFSFELKLIKEKNMPDRYNAALCSESNYIFFPCRAESLEQFLTACTKGNRYYLKTFESFDGKKVAEIEYDETKKSSESLKIYDNGSTYTLDRDFSFGRVCWSPDSVFAAFINMINLNGMPGSDNCINLYDSRNHHFYNVVNPKTILSAFNEQGIFKEQITEIYLHPRIQWSTDSKRILFTAYPAINDNKNAVAHLIYDVAQDKVVNIDISPKGPING